MDKVVACARCNFQIFHRVPDSRARTLAQSDDSTGVVIDARIRPLCASGADRFSVLERRRHQREPWAFQWSGNQRGSAKTIVVVGIAFATSPNYGPPATNGTVFSLNEKKQQLRKLESGHSSEIRASGKSAEKLFATNQFQVNWASWKS